VGNSAAEATISMTAKDLMANRNFPVISYVTENTSRSSLALKNNRDRSHDLAEGEWLSVSLRPSSGPRSSTFSSLYVASCVALNKFDEKGYLSCRVSEDPRSRLCENWRLCRGTILSRAASGHLKPCAS
jgi:hypothetical protein